MNHLKVYGYQDFILIKEHFWKIDVWIDFRLISYLDFHACWRRIVLFLDLVLILLWINPIAGQRVLT